MPASPFDTLLIQLVNQGFFDNGKVGVQFIQISTAELNCSFRKQITPYPRWTLYQSECSYDTEQACNCHTVILFSRVD